MISALSLQRVLPNRAVYDKLFADLLSSTDAERADEIFHTLKQIQLAHPRSCCKLIWRGVSEKCKIEEWDYFIDLLVKGCSVPDDEAADEELRRRRNARLLLTYFIGFFAEEQASGVPATERSLWRLVHTGEGPHKLDKLLDRIFDCLLHPDQDVIDLLQVLFDKLASMHFHQAASRASEKLNEFNRRLYNNFVQLHDERLQIVFVETCTNMWAKLSLIDNVMRQEYATLSSDLAERRAAKPISAEKFGEFYYALKPKRKQKAAAQQSGLERFVMFVSHLLQAYLSVHRLILQPDDARKSLEGLQHSTQLFADQMKKEVTHGGHRQGEMENVDLWLDEMTTIVNCF